MYVVKEQDSALLLEFRDRERKEFSLELRRLLNRLRLVPLAGREVAVTVEPGVKWRLARLGPHRGDRLEFIDDRIFTSVKEAEFEVLKLRWRRLTPFPLRLAE